ncbi:MAG: hypothetical protein ACPGVK_08550 [Halocynthiibacter sp.]
MCLKPLIASYGGGHVQIGVALARGFISRGDKPDVIGLTTAYAEYHRQGIEAKSIAAFWDPEEDQKWLELVEEFVTGHSHPDISAEDTRIYFALGLRDMALTLGEEKALEQLRLRGREAFCPVGAARRYLQKTKPDIVITTTSPRFELALQIAAKQEGIPSLAVGDLFLRQEKIWITLPEYGPNLAVLSSPVKESMVAEGFPRDGIRVTGNPAFDNLVLGPDAEDKRNALRETIGFSDKSIILFPAPSRASLPTGEDFIDIETLINRLEEFCSEHTEFAYVIRAHPNGQVAWPTYAKHGVLDDGRQLSAAEVILLSDSVLVETSTMGFEAALMGKNVICVGFEDYVDYTKFGFGQACDTLEEALHALLTLKEGGAPNMDMPPLGTATMNVLDFVDAIVSGSLAPASALPSD